MKIILKIFKYLALTLVVVLVLLMGLTLVVQGRITQIFTSEVNKYSETGISVEKIGFSLIRKFPKATVEFKNLKIEAHQSSDQWIDSLMTGRSFLDAGSVYASFNIRDILQKEFIVDRITLKNSEIILFKDDDGPTVRRILKEEFRKDSSRVSFDLENIRLENTNFKYLSNNKHFILDCTVDNTQGKLSHGRDETTILVKTGFNLNNISSKDRRILKPLGKGEIDGELLITPDSVYFKQLELYVDNQQFDITGSVFQKKRNLALDISTANIELAWILDYFTLEKDFKQNLSVNKLNAGLKLDFDRAAQSFYAKARSFNIKYAGTDYQGTAKLENLNNPLIDLRINGPIDLNKLGSVHPVDKIESVEGKAYLNAMLQGRTGKLKNIGLDDILKLKRRINLHLSDVSLKLKNYSYPLENISGNIMIADNAWADELSLLVAEQNVVMNCLVINPDGFLSKNNKAVDIKAGIWADKLDKSLLLLKNDEPQTANDEGKHSPANIQGENSERKTLNDKQFFDRINASLSITVDSLIINDFRCSQFDGIISYRPALVNISSFNLLALEGSLAGNAALAKNSAGDYQVRAWFDIEAIDIHRAFKVFNNFKQEQIVAENINGDLSGSLSISTKLDTSFKLLPPTLSVTGSYSIFDGELIDFEPIMKLSRFIEVSELENIVFEDLHNDLLISDSRVLIPSMEINSSAFNISLSGEQDFSGDFEYHLSVLLSEILSKKARNSGSYISEFGPVEDDGLGRTNLFLKLEKYDGETKVSYDVKKLSEELKESLKEEKKSLKTILNEEYGWYNADSLVSNPETSSRKFRITWEEADSVKTIIPEETVQRTGRSGILKKIFKADTTKKKF